MNGEGKKGSVQEGPFVARRWLSQGRTPHEREMFLKNNSLK